MLNINIYLKRFYSDFDLIKIVTSNQVDFNVFLPKHFTLPSPPRFHYLIGLIMILYLGFDSLFIVLKNGVFKRSDWKTIASLDRLFTHRIFPKMFFVISQMASVVRNYVAIETTNYCLCQFFINFYEIKKQQENNQLLSRIKLKILLKESYKFQITFIVF